MIDRLVRWLLSKVKAETVQRLYVNKIYLLAKLLQNTYDISDGDDKLRHQMSIIAFNVKYKDFDERLEGTPHDEFIKFMTQAKEGNFSFLHHPLYMTMKAMKDKEVIKLKLILNRTRR